MWFAGNSRNQLHSFDHANSYGKKVIQHLPPRKKLRWKCWISSICICGYMRNYWLYLLCVDEYGTSSFLLWSTAYENVRLLDRKPNVKNSQVVTIPPQLKHSSLSLVVAFRSYEHMRPMRTVAASGIPLSLCTCLR